MYGGALIGASIVGIYTKSIEASVLLFILCTGILATYNGFSR